MPSLLANLTAKWIIHNAAWKWRPVVLCWFTLVIIWCLCWNNLSGCLCVNVLRSGSAYLFTDNLTAQQLLTRPVTSSERLVWHQGNGFALTWKWRLHSRMLPVVCHCWAMCPKSTAIWHLFFWSPPAFAYCWRPVSFTLDHLQQLINHQLRANTYCF